MDEVDFFVERSKRTKPKRMTAVTPLEAVPIKGGRGSAWKFTRTGYREDLDMVLRSGWEANVARVLNSFDIKFDFEPVVYTFPIARGTKSYTPDFFLRKTEEWIEVKGFFDNTSRIKLKRFKRYYPDQFENLTMIVGNSKASLEICQQLKVPRVLIYQEISKAFKDQVPNWEGR